MPTTLRQLLLRALAVAALVAGGQAQAGYVLSEVARPGADSTALFDINNAGTMVGYSVTGSGLATEARAFVSGDGLSFTELAGPAGAVASYALGISDGGTVVGNFHTSKSLDVDGTLVYGPSSGFIFSGGSYTTFNVAGANDTFLRGISPDGRFVSGYYSTATQPGVGFVYDTASGTLQTTSVATSVFTIMQGINAAGVAVGSDIRNDGSRPGLLFDTSAGTLSEARIAGAQRTALRSIEDDGTLAGWFRDAGGDIHGFIGSLTDFEEINFTGASATFVEGSNRLGTIVGTANVGEFSRAFIGRTSAVPEPATLALLGLAALLAAGAARSRHR